MHYNELIIGRTARASQQDSSYHLLRVHSFHQCRFLVPAMNPLYVAFFLFLLVLCSDKEACDITISLPEVS